MGQGTNMFSRFSTQWHNKVFEHKVARWACMSVVSLPMTPASLAMLEEPCSLTFSTGQAIKGIRRDSQQHDYLSPELQSPSKCLFLIRGSVAVTCCLHRTGCFCSLGRGKGSEMSGNKINSVFYAESYHPIQAGSIDGTDILPHDKGVYRAFLCSSAGLYDPSGDSKIIGDPYCTVFVSHLSRLTTEDTLGKAMGRFGRVRSLRMVRDIVTGASRGYAFIEYETEREMRHAYKEAHHSFIDDCEIIVDYSRQQLMPGWIPRRLGGGLGGKKESGQLRFGGRERPFRAPLRSIPFEELKMLGIPPPPEGRYMSRFQVPSPPRSKRSSVDREESSYRRSAIEEEERSRITSLDYYNKRSSLNVEERFGKRSSVEMEEYYDQRSYLSEHSHKRISREREDRHHKGSSVDREESSHERSGEREKHSHKRSLTDREKHSQRRSSKDGEKHYHKRRKHESWSQKHDGRSNG